MEQPGEGVVDYFLQAPAERPHDVMSPVTPPSFATAPSVKNHLPSPKSSMAQQLPTREVFALLQCAAATSRKSELFMDPEASVAGL